MAATPYPGKSRCQTDEESRIRNDAQIFNHMRSRSSAEREGDFGRYLAGDSSGDDWRPAALIRNYSQILKNTRIVCPVMATLPR
jgi:hypothetical protein